jgi:hypothetical protein
VRETTQNYVGTYKTITMEKDTCKKCGSIEVMVDVEFFPEENNHQPIYGCHCDDNDVIINKGIHCIYPNPWNIKTITMKEKMSTNKVQAWISIVLGSIVIGTLITALIIGGNELFLWMYVTALASAVLFLLYNSWVYNYINRERH